MSRKKTCHQQDPNLRPSNNASDELPMNYMGGHPSVLFIGKQVKEMFYHAYRAYMENAYPADELMPLSCKGRYRGTEANRGDIDDALGNFSLTLVDTMDTLMVSGKVKKLSGTCLFHASTAHAQPPGGGSGK
ncbi:hypothetical protein HPB51_012265 [Rhipicephalus microplus]|uniref:alpha-1,2-Mannosidase n=1 Tax=Rhipicephalus microplus TaxID=6941 RepID=A0A9J6EG39_RHIMP|nr:hypothetical protein HPB51_012265 [Rhipicephalus microplus]